MFFCVRKGTVSILDEYKKQTSKDEDVTGILNLQVKYEQIIRNKNSNERINMQDIENSEEEDNVKQALKEWLGIKNKMTKIWISYIIYIVIGFAIVPNLFRQGHFPWFFISYTLMFLLSTSFYLLLFSKLYIKSFLRLSYSILYPTILSIAVNIYFGLSMNAFCVVILPLSNVMSIFIFILFFVITAIFEIKSYKLDGKNANKCSTHGFVWTSISLLCLTIIGFLVSTSKHVVGMTTDSFSNQLFAIALSLYLGIFEGWDALHHMCLEKRSEILANHYRWWNFLQACYPLAFFFLMSIVNSEIFTFGLMIAFTGVSVVSMIVWKRGGEKEDYEYNTEPVPWARLKCIFGVITMLFVFLNRILFMNNMFSLKNPPANLNTESINLTLIVFFLGLISSIFILLGDDKNDQKKIVVMAFPFKNMNEYKDFSEFCSYGYIYDFSNYIYLFYILIVHVLLFSTKFIPARSNEFENASTILLIFMIIIYMALSFRAKIEKKYKKN